MQPGPSSYCPRWHPHLMLWDSVLTLFWQKIWVIFLVGINRVVSDAVLLHVNGTVAFILWFEPNATKRQKYISPINIIDQAPFQGNCGFRHWLIDWPLITLHNHSQQTAKIQILWHNENKHKDWDDGIQISLCTLSLGLILTIISSLAGGQISCLLLSKIINLWES